MRAGQTKVVELGLIGSGGAAGKGKTGAAISICTVAPGES